MNLVVDTMEATDAKTQGLRELLVTSQVAGPGHVEVSVKDSGVGIEPKDIDHLFRPFFTTKPGGMAMGLSISNSIIESHCGHLWATPNEGAGATFRFSLPINGAA